MRGAADETLAGLQPLIQAQARRLASYRCGHCGFRARDFHWQCPGCKAWDSQRPLLRFDLVAGLEGAKKQ